MWSYDALLFVCLDVPRFVGMQWYWAWVGCSGKMIREDVSLVLLLANGLAVRSWLRRQGLTGQLSLGVTFRLALGDVAVDPDEMNQCQTLADDRRCGWFYGWGMLREGNYEVYNWEEVRSFLLTLSLQQQTSRENPGDPDFGNLALHNSFPRFRMFQVDYSSGMGACNVNYPPRIWVEFDQILTVKL